MYKILAALLFVTGVIFSPTSIVHAEETTTTPQVSDRKSPARELRQTGTNEMEEKKAQAMEAKEEAQSNRMEVKETKVQERCEMIATKVEQRKGNYEANKTKHAEHYANVDKRMESLIDKLDENDYDTTTLKANLAKLNTMTAEYASMYGEFIDSLETAKGLTCGNSEGAYKTALQESRGQLTDAQAKRAEIQTFFKTSIKTELDSIKEEYGRRSKPTTTN